MINEFFMQKSDIIDISQKRVAANTPEVTTEILKGATDVVSVIKAIETYNDSNKLPYDKRYKYAIGVAGEVYYTVAQGYFIGDSMFSAVVYENNGYVGFKYGKGEDANRLTDARPVLSTHLIPVSQISDVVLPGYDTGKITIDPIVKDTSMSERELVNIITKLSSDIAADISAGLYKTAIKVFNIGFKTHKLNDIDYSYKREAYSAYIKLFTRYIELVTSICTHYDEDGKGVKKGYRNNMYYVDDTNDSTIDMLVEDLENYGSRESKIDKVMLKERIFSDEDVEMYCKIIGKTFTKNTDTYYKADPVVNTEA